MKRRIAFNVVLFSLITLSGCVKNDHPVPYVPVNINVYITDPEFVHMNAVGNWVYLTGGSRGIILYRRSVDDFVALERHSTISSNENCALAVVDSNNITASESCAGGQYLITDGSVIAGDTQFPLLQYATTFNGTLVTIRN